jgi:hypothetical protein
VKDGQEIYTSWGKYEMNIQFWFKMPNLRGVFGDPMEYWRNKVLVLIGFIWLMKGRLFYTH